MRKGIRRALLIALFAPIVLILCLLGVLIYELIHANTAEIKDETVCKLIQFHFDIEIPDSSTFMYKHYGTNIREEFFTIIVRCDDGDIKRIIIEKTDTRLSLSELKEVIGENAFNMLADNGYTDFYVYTQYDEIGLCTYLIAVSTDQPLILFNYDP
ncbi:MAG: hypothetical protein IK127_07710 [Clostridia bacterium]|nr:hypothetical protein [Clostridia bacterium]